MDDAPLSAQTVHVKELLKKDVDRWWFLENLQALAYDGTDESTKKVRQRFEGVRALCEIPTSHPS